MVAIREVVVTEQQLSAAMLSRSMQMHNSPTKTIQAEHMCSFQHQVYSTRKKVCAQQFKGFELNESADCHLWSTLVLKHNDPKDDYHICLHDFCVISHQNIQNEAALDVLHMNM
jgi:hypothetical protein